MNRQSIIELFDQSAKRFRGHLAIECAQQRVTYGELADRSTSLANYLISQGAAKGSIVAILAEDAIEVITSIIGILKAGCVFVPLEPRIPESRLQAMIAEVSPTWFIVEPEFLPRLEKVVASGARIICVDGNGAHEHRGESSACTEHERIPLDRQTPSAASGPDDMCYIYFTSGSTGKPKGIAGRRKGIDHFIQWEIKTLNVTEETRVSQLTGASFDAMLRDVFVPLCAGGTICVPEDRETIIDAPRLIDWLDSRRLSIIHCVPTVFRSLVNEHLRPEYFSALKYILMAGEPLLPADVKKWMEVYGERVQLVNLYGPTETTMTKFFYFVTPQDKDRRFIPIGKPMEGARALVVDPRGSACPPGAVGEIYIRTPFRSLGYYNQPELTREVFIKNPFNDDPNDIVYKTGDLGRILEDGNFEFLGRKDSQVKIRGVRIELAEIESQLREHESVRNVAVIDRENSRGDKYLCAYVVSTGEFDHGALRSFLSQRLPEYMIPAFMQVDELPMTLSGKVDRRALPDPKHVRLDDDDVTGPRDAVELRLTNIWKDVLNVKPIGVQDNFFDLGGHSFLAVSLMSRIEREFGVKLPLAVLFQGATVESLGVMVRQQVGSTSASSLVRIQPNGAKQPLFCAHPAGGNVICYMELSRHLGPEQPLYGLQARGLNAEAEPLTRIEEMAEHYIEEIQAVQPTGPYRLLGWSLGGIVAFEIAHQLHNRGEQVELVALLDTGIHDPRDAPKEVEEADDAYKLLGAIGELRPELLEHLRTLQPDEQIEYVVDWGHRTNALPPDFGFTQVRHLFNIYKSNVQAVRNYIPKVYPGHVTLFRAEEELAKNPHRLLHGWDKYAAGGVDVHVVPGSHFDMAYRPHVSVLCEQLNLTLEKLQSENHSQVMTSNMP